MGMRSRRRPGKNMRLNPNLPLRIVKRRTRRGRRGHPAPGGRKLKSGTKGKKGAS